MTMNITRHNNHNKQARGLPSWISNLLLGTLTAVTLAACDSVPTETTIDPGTAGSIAGYTGNACGTGASDAAAVSDACNFKVEFWDKMRSVSQCANCHNTQTSNQNPMFMDSADVNFAYTQMINPTLNNLANLIDRDAPANSGIITKIRTGGHNCGDTNSCDALATTVEGYLSNWVGGGSAAGGSIDNVVILKSPIIKTPGQSKTLPPASPTAPSGFTNNVYPLLSSNCSDCHQATAPIAVTAPFFAEGNADGAYSAILTSQKINLDDPAISRLVVRLRDEAHNCWDPVNTGSINCADSANTMLAAIEAFADSVALSTVDSNWKISSALKLSDGQVASSGSRDDSSTIVLYKFQSGSGSTILDISGVGSPLNLNLYGTEGVDYQWVGGWGIEFLSAAGKAQGSTQQSAKLRDYITASGEYSIEAWVVPGNASQGDANNPSRIISYSSGPTERNFTLGQSEYRYAFMNRSTSILSDDNGEPSFLTNDGDEDLQATQQHVVVTFSPAAGRKIFVNGIDVALDDNPAMADEVMPPGGLTNWDETFAFILGNEASNDKPWAGKLRLVAIHNRAMSASQIQQNFNAGVGEKFFLLFNISNDIADPACMVASVPQCFVYFIATQFDSYSYLFNRPTFISLNSNFNPSGTVIKGMRIGLNGKEPAVGQAYAKLDATINGNDYSLAGQPLSSLGTIIALEKGSDNDEFFLTFENIDGNLNVRTPSICGTNINCTTTPTNGTATAAIGLRTFEEILASMAVVTGVDPYLPTFSAVLNTYYQDFPRRPPNGHCPARHRLL
jgi:Concanavalin A-like lectin/glucanases superfamily